MGQLKVDKSNRGAHGFKSVEDLAAWKKEEFEWKLSAEKILGRVNVLNEVQPKGHSIPLQEDTLRTKCASTWLVRYAS